MSDMLKKTPWHLWVVGVVGILWNSYGCYDYTMSEWKGEPYLRGVGMTDAQIAYFNAMPVWMTADWAIGVWGAMLGSILLLLRNKLAYPVFAISLAAYLISLLYAYVLSDGSKVMPANAWVMNVVILIGCLFFLWYSRMAVAKGILR